MSQEMEDAKKLLRGARAEMELKIQEAIEEFQARTSLRVESVTLRYHERVGVPGRTVFCVDAEVRI